MQDSAFEIARENRKLIRQLEERVDEQNDRAEHLASVREELLRGLVQAKDITDVNIIAGELLELLRCEERLLRGVDRRKMRYWPWPATWPGRAATVLWIALAMLTLGVITDLLNYATN